MDLTAEFHRLAGISNEASKSTRSVVASSAFVRAAAAQKQRLSTFRHSVHSDSGLTAEIRSCEKQMKELEQLTEDYSDLSVPSPWRSRDHVANRRAIITGLFEELRELAVQVQSTAMSEQRREAEAAGFFVSNVTRSSVAKIKPPAALPPPPQHSGGSFQSNANSGQQFAENGSEEAERLKAEEQVLKALFESDLDQINETQTKISEIATMMSVFSTKVVEQHEQVDNIHGFAEESTDLVEQAGKHLDRAIDNSNSYRFYVVCWFVGSAIALLIFDFIDERYFWI